MAGENLLGMLFWLAELIVASFLLSYGVEHLSVKLGGRFVGRTLMSIATTLPEIAIVVFAASEGSFGVAIGAGLGSNMLMMTLGLSLMLLVATTRLSSAPLKGIDVSKFKLDKLFLILTAISSALLFIDGYNYIDGFIFSGFFGAYLVFAFREMKEERKELLSKPPVAVEPVDKDTESPRLQSGEKSRVSIARATVIFVVGTVGIFFGAGPFIQSLQGFAVESGVSAVVLAVVISPIAGEMPEKVSMVILARKGELGASIAVANVLGSKILNNTLLLAVAVFGAMAHEGFFAHIAATPILVYQMVLVTSVTILALIPMFRQKIGLRTGAFLISMYVASIVIQFQLLKVSGG